MNDKIKFTKGIGLWIFTREKKKKKKSKKGKSLASILEERDKQWKARSSFGLQNRRKKEREGKKIRLCSPQLTRMQNSTPAKLGSYSMRLWLSFYIGLVRESSLIQD